MAETKVEKAKLSCFVIMPITDPTGYPMGHCARVYEHLIKPACIAAGYEPLRADEVQAANYIVLDVLHRIMNSDMVVCDLSGKNPNVLYELGIRQAFDRPVVLLKDRQTERIFDIQGLRTVEYDETLRVDLLARDAENLKAAIETTAKPAPHDVNSLVKLLGVAAAKGAPKTEISGETALILDALKDLAGRMGALENKSRGQDVSEATLSRWIVEARNRSGAFATELHEKVRLPSGSVIKRGDTIYMDDGKPLGQVMDISNNKRADGAAPIAIKSGAEIVVIEPEDERYAKLRNVPF